MRRRVHWFMCIALHACLFMSVTFILRSCSALPTASLLSRHSTLQQHHANTQHKQARPFAQHCREKLASDQQIKRKGLQRSGEGNKHQKLLVHVAEFVQKKGRLELRGGDGEAWNRGTALMILGTSSAGLLRGFETGIIAGALMLISPAFNLESRPSMQGMIATAATAGAVLGTLTAGRAADMYGRKISILMGSVLTLVGSILCAWSPNVSVLSVGRFLSGVAVGHYR